MRNSPALPIIALAAAVALAVTAALAYAAGPAKPVVVLSEVEIALTAWALALAVYGVQGLTSVMLEGRELRPGVVRPRLTDPFSVAIVGLSALLLGAAIVLGWGISAEWKPRWLGMLAGAGCFDLALLLAFYKEAFIGNEASFEERNDGVPW
jgi:hypothetical protein